MTTRAVTPLWLVLVGVAAVGALLAVILFVAGVLLLIASTSVVIGLVAQRFEARRFEARRMRTRSVATAPPFSPEWTDALARWRSVHSTTLRGRALFDVDVPRGTVLTVDRSLRALTDCRYGHHDAHALLGPDASGRLLRECAICQPPTRWTENP